MLKNFKINSFPAAAATAAVMALILEIFLFNFRHFQPMNNEIHNLTIEEDGNLITIKDINDRVDNIYIELDTADSTNEITLYAADECNAISYELGKRTYVDSVEASHYMQLNLSGNAGEIKLITGGSDGTAFVKDSIALNVRKPIKLSFLRTFITFVFIASLICIYKGIDIPYCSESWYKYILITAVFCTQILFIGKTAAMNPDFTSPPWSWHKQYQDLAESFLEGKLYVYDDAPQCLIDMENPYDTELRNLVMKENGTSCRWDTAFYEGKYYVYFGAVPVILFYIPYYLIYGEPLPNYMAVLYSAIIFAVSVFGLIGSIIKRYFKDVSLLSGLLIIISVINGCGIIFLVKRPDLYSVPIMTGIAFTVLGLCLWNESLWNIDRTRGKVLLALGSLSMALVAGCRPQLLLGSFAALFIFGRYFLDGLKNRKKDVFVSAAAFLVPYLVVAAVIMWYNFSRFGSFFDFGANYNLTTNDMTGRGLDMDRNGIAIFSYLFQPPHISAVFPFLNSARYYTTYLGNDIWETLYGGLITSNMFMWIVFFVQRVKKSICPESKKVFGMGVWFLVSAVIMVFADAQMGGVLQRYFSDAGIFLALCSAVLWLFLLNDCGHDIKKLLFTASAFTLAYNVLMIFITGSRGLNNGNPELYYTFYHLIQFWL